MSVSASGRFGGSMVFSNWKGRAYTRKLVTPKNPRAPKQLGVRAMMAFLGSLWAGIAGATQDSWNALAAAKGYSPFNAYVSANLKRWQANAGPSQASPAADASTPLTITTMTLTGEAGYATVEITPSGNTALWGYAIFRDDAQITNPNWANCIACIEANGSTPVTYTDAPLAAGTYHYRVATLQTDGVIGTIKADASCAVTAP